MENKIKKLFILLIILFNIVIAQDNINPEQAQQIITKMNLTPSEVDREINTRNLNNVQKKELIESIKKDDGDNAVIDKIDSDTIENDEDEKIANIRSDKFIKEISNSTRGFYGYDLFSGSSGFKPSPSVTSFSDYQVGPGDEIIISLWGDVELRKEITVSKEGTVYISNVGLVSVNGMKMEKLESKLKKLLSKAYMTLDPPQGEASTYMDVSLGKLKPISVYIVGEVFKKGVLKLDSYSTVFNALYKSGGPTTKGSLRDIQVIRDGTIIARIDIYDYLLTGKKVNDIVLKNQDNILVPPRISSLKLRGEVKKESVYELKKDENLRDLIKFSGGIPITANLDRVQIERIVPFKNRTDEQKYSKEIVEFELGDIINGAVNINPVPLEDGDEVSVFPISEILINFVNIKGPVILPGKYSLKEGMTLGSLIEKAGGLLPDAFMSRVLLTRTMPDLSTKLFNFDLNSEKDLEFKLKTSDEIEIFSIWDLNTRNEVSLKGHVRNPGKYVLHEGAKISDLIFKSGGIEDDFFKKRTFLKRADLIRYNDDGITTRIIPINLGKALDGDLKEDIVLENKDILKIYDVNVSLYKKQVVIKGHIRNPGNYDLQTNMRVEDLILQAGGLTKSAYYLEAEVFRIDPYNITTEKLVSVHKVKLEEDYFAADSRTINGEFILKDMDIVVVRKFPNYQFQKTVQIKGEVKFPGTYSLLSDQETLSEVIKRAGGLKIDAFSEGIRFERDSMQILSNFSSINKNSKGGRLILQHDDIIYIPKHPGIVSVEGFVFTPGLVKYERGWSLSDYVEAAGGVMIDDNYMKGETVVYYPGGAAEVDGWLFSPEVKEGSRIVVKRVKKPEEKEGMTMKEWVGLFASIVSISYYLSNIN